MAKRTQAQRHSKVCTLCLVKRDVAEVVIVTVLVGLLVTAVHKLQASDNFSINNVHFISRMQHCSQEELKRAVVSSLKGGFFSVDLERIERALEALPWIATASVRRQWPDTLLIKIIEQEAIARWGKDGLLNPHGEVFYPRDTLNRRELPVLYGPEGRERELIARFRRILRTLLPAGLKLRALVEDDRRAWHLLLANGIPVALGRIEPGKRVERFVHIYPRILAPKASEIAGIDLRYTNGFSVAWKSTDSKDKEADRRR
jgi:cell division protein FtsQ